MRSSILAFAALFLLACAFPVAMALMFWRLGVSTDLSKFPDSRQRSPLEKVILILAHDPTIHEREERTISSEGGWTVRHTYRDKEDFERAVRKLSEEHTQAP
jgi:hypothetical protein